MIEIRWHGRGGQGTKTASLLLADAVFATGKYVQGFPEYGPERTGAPLTAYNRVADERILIHSNVYNPNFVVVVDESLMGCITVDEGIQEGGAILVNTEKSVEEIREKLVNKDIKIYTVAADKIALEEIGRVFPNTAMLSAIIKISNLIKEEDFIRVIRESLERQFATKPDVIETNVNAIKRAWKEIGE